MRNVILIVLALLVGVAAGLGASRLLAAGGMAPPSATDGPAAPETRWGAPAGDDTEAEFARLEAENTRLRNELRGLRDLLAEARATLAAEPTSQEEDSAGEEPQAGSLLEGLLAGISSPETEEPPRRRWGGGDTPGPPEGMREHIHAMLDARRAQSTDPAEQERLTALMEYTDYLSTLREQMHGAESDEERDTLRAEFFDAIQDVRQIMEAQRRGALAGLATRYGITDTRQQERFLRDMQRVLEDPMLGGGFGRSGGGPGRGFGPR